MFHGYSHSIIIFGVNYTFLQKPLEISTFTVFIVIDIISNRYFTGSSYSDQNTGYAVNTQSTSNIDLVSDISDSVYFSFAFSNQWVLVGTVEVIFVRSAYLIYRRNKKNDVVTFKNIFGYLKNYMIKRHLRKYNQSSWLVRFVPVVSLRRYFFQL